MSSITNLRLAPDRRLQTLTNATTEVALCKEIFKSLKEELDKVSWKKKGELGDDLRNMQRDLTGISNRYDDLATTSELFVLGGVRHADDMVDVIDCILNDTGDERELRQRVKKATDTGDALSEQALTLGIKFQLLNESLGEFRQSIEQTILNAQKEKRNRKWWKKLMDRSMTLLKALAIVMGILGIIFTMVSAGPAGVVVGGGLLIAALATGTVTQAVETLVSLVQDDTTTEESKLDQFITVLTSMESQMETVTKHFKDMDQFLGDQGKNLHMLTVQGKRITFAGGVFETQNLNANKQAWQEAKESFEAYLGQARHWKRDSSRTPQLQLQVTE